MEQSVVNRILDIQEKMQSDDTLMAEYQARQHAFLSMLPELTESQRNTIWDYLGVCTEIHLRMLSVASDAQYEK